jgi:hypothetical protein
MVVNATLAGAWEGIDDPMLSINPYGEVWTQEGALDGSVTVGVASQHLKQAIQAAVDAERLIPGNMTVQLEVNVSGPTAGEVRLSNLTVRYTPFVNEVPYWLDVPEIDMMEDVDAVRALDLSVVTDDDVSADDLIFEVVNSTTPAIEAVVDDGHFLSIHINETNWNGVAYFTVKAIDPWGGNASSPDIRVIVNPVNDPPIVSEPGRQFAVQGVPWVFQAEVYDVEDGALLFSDDTDIFDIDTLSGRINFTPTNDHVGLHFINITVTDDVGGETVVEFRLTVENVNDPPTIVDSGPLTGRQGETFNHEFAVLDPDLMHGDLLTWSIGDPYYSSILELNPTTGNLTWKAVDNDDVGMHTFPLQVTDGGGLADGITVNLTIENVNDPPIFIPIPDQQMYEDGHLSCHLSFVIRVNDPDLKVDPEEALTWNVDPPLFVVAPDGTFSFDATYGDIGRHSIHIIVTDRMGETFGQSFFLTVEAVNHPPSISTIVDQVAHEDQEFVLLIEVSDPDAGDIVQLSARGAPFEVPADGGTLRWVPQERHGGDHLVTLEARDLAGLATVMAFNLTVVTYNDPPEVDILAPIEGRVFPHGDEIHLRADAFDEEGEHLTYTWSWRYNDVPGAQWERMDTGPSAYWTQAPSGPIRVRLEVSDGALSATDEVVIQVEAPVEEEGGLSIWLLAAIALAVVAVLVALMLLNRRGDDTGEEKEEPDDEWEAVEEEDNNETYLPK